MAKLQAFIQDLRAYQPGAGVFNPWRDADLDYDTNKDAPEIRARQLEQYLRMRIPGARWLLVAEAAGFQGCRFSGIAMTSERILLGHRPDIDPNWVLPSGFPRRTSRPDAKPDGFNEPTATIVWGAMHENGIAPSDYILWNTFPFHPFHAGEGPLTNRTPKGPEIEAGAGFLHRMLGLVPGAKVIAVGNKAAAALAEMGVECGSVRHPANGGANAFRAGLKELLRQPPRP